VAAGRGHLGRRQVTQRPVRILLRTFAVLLLLAPLGAAAQDELRGYREALARGDYNAVVAELRPLADAGNAEAQCRLGMLYVEGMGVRPSDALGASWLRRAADQGHGEAQYQLGRLYLSGRGVPDDRREAIAWISKAAEGGYPPASKLLRQLRGDK